MSSKILLVDGHSIVNRAFYGLPPLTNSRGIHTNALLGFFTILWKTIDQIAPDKLAVAFDLSAPTFRHELYADYKGTRSKMPEELVEQIEPLKELLQSAGVTLLSQEGFEADDMLGSMAKTCGKNGDRVYILSGDRDLLQLVDETITLLIPKTKKGGTETEVYDPEVLQKTYGVDAEGFLHMKALMGDPSDNIPGVPGIGEKTASKIISEYKSLEEAILHAGDIRPAKAGENLRNHVEEARLSLQLATIITDIAPLPEASALGERPFASPAFVEGLKTYELKSLLNRVLERSGRSGEKRPVASPAAPAFPSREVRSAWTSAPAEQTDVPNLPELLGRRSLEEAEKILSASAAKLSVVLCEEAGEVIGCGLATEKEAFFVEEKQEKIWGLVTPHLVKKDTEIITFDSKKLHHLSLSLGGRVEGPLTDLLIGAYLLHATKGNYDAQETVRAYAGLSLKSEAEVLGSGAKKLGWSFIPPEETASFFEETARGLLCAAEPLKKELRDKGMWELYESIEMPLTYVLSSMEHQGIAVDLSVLESIGSALRESIARLTEEIYELAGEPFNINSPKQLGVILFEKLSLPAGKKTKSGYSTSAEVLEDLRYMHPLVDKVLEYRQLSKLESTYVEGLRPFVGADGKIHCRFQQAVTSTGRLSCADPNLQNIPIREELGRTLRKAFVPRSSEYLFMDADYSQIELRLLAHMSGDEALIRAYREGADIHRLTASQVLHKAYEAVTDAERSSAKAVNFGIVYGISAFSLSQDLHISQKEAKAYIEHYFERFPGVKAYLDSSVEKAKKEGAAKTLYGRARAMDELKSSNFALRSFGERVARNMPIQGTAADIIKIAMNRVFARLEKEGLKSRLLVQVHDELLLEVYRPEEEKVRKILNEEMCGAAELSVPLAADIHTGENWYEAK